MNEADDSPSAAGSERAPAAAFGKEFASANRLVPRQHQELGSGTASVAA